MILVYGLSNSSDCNDLECPCRSFPYGKPFQVRYFLLTVRRAVTLHLQSFLSSYTGGQSKQTTRCTYYNTSHESRGEVTTVMTWHSWVGRFTSDVYVMGDGGKDGGPLASYFTSVVAAVFSRTVCTMYHVAKSLPAPPYSD